jgi:hypothetical protein
MAEQHRRQPRLRGSVGVHRRLEDATVAYWRSRVGWSDDDETMKNYNEGVYSSYYGGDVGSTSSSGGHRSFSNTSKRIHLPWILGIVSSFIFLILLVRCCSAAPPKSDRKGRTSSVKSSRDSSRSVRDKHGERRSRSRSHAASDRSRSKSRTQSKSQSRSRRSDGDGGDDSDVDYKLMDEEDAKSRSSRKSSRSKSRSTRSSSRSTRREGSPSSRSLARSRSKSRKSSSRRDAGEDGDITKDAKEQKMLV